MAFTGRVNIVQRKKVLHCGWFVRIGFGKKYVSVCNKTWDINDKVYEADAADVTCKRCQRLLERADETGSIEFGRRKRA